MSLRTRATRGSRDLRTYASSTQARLLLGGILLLLVAGTGLIAFFYGPSAATGAFLCILAGVLPISLIFLGLRLMDWLVRRGRDG